MPVVIRRKRKARPRVKRAAAARQQTKLQNDIGFIGKALRGLGGLGGSALGGIVGMPKTGSALGSSLGAALSRWVGAGDYEVSNNSIVQRAASSIPMMHKTGQSVIIRHREFIASIKGSTAFDIQQEITLNPGMAASFPWLSRIASAFQQYEVKGMVYHYIPSSGTAVSSTNSALGTVMIQTSYRSTEAAPQSKQEMLNEYWANEVVPSDTMVHPIECDPKENPFAVHYVRSGSIPSGEPLMYDLGKTFVATQGMQSNNIVGDLWVTYEIELKKPLLTSDVTQSVWTSSMQFTAPKYNDFFNTPGSSTGNLFVEVTGPRTLRINTDFVGKAYVIFTMYEATGFDSPSDVGMSGSVTFAGPVSAYPMPANPGLAVKTDAQGTDVSLTTITYQFAFNKTAVEPAAIAFPSCTSFPDQPNALCIIQAFSLPNYY